MNKRLLFSAFCLIAFTTCSFLASAFSTSNYASSSCLATGKWVKIEIPEDGIYQITYSELRSMGFDNPKSVRIFGTGGHPISEILDGSAIDDLAQIPCKDTGSKLCFYGCGPTDHYLVTPTTTPRFLRSFNSYSRAGYYFITSNDRIPAKEPETRSYSITGQNLRASSLDYATHEQELISVSQSGKDMLGETFENNNLSLRFSLPELCSDSSIIVNPCIAAKSQSISTISGTFNNEELSFTIGLPRIYAASSQYVFYNTANTAAIYNAASSGATIDSNDISIGFNIENTALKWARLDFCILTYYHNNTLSNAQQGQMRMAFNNVTSNDIIAVKGDNGIEMWDITSPNTPVNYTLSTYGEYQGFTPQNPTNWSQFIAFNPTHELKSITRFEEIENQNIHALPTPDMVIVTCEELLPQAERIAQMHRDNDNMTVHVLDQQKIFNEFSSGTPDAMGIRLMNKMFYDRDKDKFKYLIMFGAGKQDNRQILSNNDCTILTYESNSSNDENNSYVSDDFFGMLDDNSGTNPAGDILRLRVGRIPCATIDEATGDVDKLLNYVNNPDYGPWRNNALFIADYVSDSNEGNLHSYQAEGIGNIINDELNVGFMKNKVYVTQFNTDPATGFLLEGRRSMKMLLESGQYFMTYVGHGDGTALTKEVKLWTTNESKNTAYPHLPIVSTACCDVARYDGSQRGVMEIMFHKPDGGAIAMLTATRSAYASGNDALNQAFVRGLFSYSTTGQMPTVGDAYMLCKQSFGTTASYNKMMFTLLGDPAIKVNYPKPFFKITKINGKNASTSNIYTGPLQQVTVEAKVYTPDGTAVDASFNGDATLSIYDYLKKETTENNRDIYYPRKLLTEVSGRVTNGIFTAQTVIPRYTLYPGVSGLVSVYAHRDNSDEMVNGSFEKLVISAYNEDNSQTIHDNVPPTIDAFYFNDEFDFEHGELVPTSSLLFIRATDDKAFSNQNLAVGNSMELKLDGGKTSYPNIKSYTTITNNGKSLLLQLPMDLSEGEHTLQYTVYDAAGNMTTKAINFAVGGNQQVSLSVEQEPAIDFATFNMSTTLQTDPTVKIRVFDYLGNIVWSDNVSSFPYDWDLKNNAGKRLQPGVYTYYGQYNDGTVHGGTNIGTIIVGEDYQTQE